MAHFAFVNNDNLVLQIALISNDVLIDADGNESEQLGINYCIEHYPMIDSSTGRWVQASYNGRIRGIYPGPGYTYCPEEDIFVSPQPFPSWVRDEYKWNPPIDKPNYPAPGWPGDKPMGWGWDETSKSWEATIYPLIWDEDSQQWIPRND